MLIIPAIDLQEGCVVRLVQGRRDKKIYSRDPVKTARHWVKAGAKFLHIVDLDGAMAGKPVNLETMKMIAAAIDIPFECGGGIRSMATIKALLAGGVARVVLGTKAIMDRDFLAKAVKQFPGKIIVSIDAREGKLCVKGWQDRTAINALPFIKDLKKKGLESIIYTDVSKDGMLKGPDIRGIKRILKESGIKMIASGGISGLDDIRKLKALEKQGVTGIIIGKALYEGRFTLPQALKLA